LTLTLTLTLTSSTKQYNDYANLNYDRNIPTK